MTTHKYNLIILSDFEILSVKALFVADTTVQDCILKLNPLKNTKSICLITLFYILNYINNNFADCEQLIRVMI